MGRGDGQWHLQLWKGKEDVQDWKGQKGNGRWGGASDEGRVEEGKTRWVCFIEECELVGLGPGTLS